MVGSGVGANSATGVSVAVCCRRHGGRCRLVSWRFDCRSRSVCSREFCRLRGSSILNHHLCRFSWLRSRCIGWHDGRRRFGRSSRPWRWLHTNFGLAAVRPYGGCSNGGDDYSEDDADDQSLSDPRPVTRDAEAGIVLIVRLVHIPECLACSDAHPAPLTFYATRMRLDVAMQ